MRKVIVSENHFEHCNTSKNNNNKNAASPTHRNMVDCYRAAYQKLYNELPLWKRKSFDSNIYRKDDALYNEFIRQVIELAEQ
jgi:hypothetical protein